MKRSGAGGPKPSKWRKPGSASATMFASWISESTDEVGHTFTPVSCVPPCLEEHLVEEVVEEEVVVPPIHEVRVHIRLVLSRAPRPPPSPIPPHPTLLPHRSFSTTSTAFPLTGD